METQYKHIERNQWQRILKSPLPPQIKDSLHVRESPIPLQADFSPEAFGSAELDVECQPLKGGHCPPTKNTYFMAKLTLNPEMGDGGDFPQVNKRRGIAH